MTNTHTNKHDTSKDYDPSKTCIVLVFAEWCGHCKNLRPIWNEFKNDIKNNSNIQIIEIEDTKQKEEIEILENKLDKQIIVKGYPTVFLIKPNNQGIEYYEMNDNNRTKDHILAWVKKHGGGMNGGGRKRRRTLRSRRNRRNTHKKR